MCIVGVVLTSRPFPEVAGAHFVDAHSALRMNSGVNMSGRCSMWCAAQ